MHSLLTWLKGGNISPSNHRLLVSLSLVFLLADNLRLHAAINRQIIFTALVKTDSFCVWAVDVFFVIFFVIIIWIFLSHLHRSHFLYYPLLFGFGGSSRSVLRDLAWVPEGCRFKSPYGPSTWTGSWRVSPPVHLLVMLRYPPIARGALMGTLYSDISLFSVCMCACV